MTERALNLTDVVGALVAWDEALLYSLFPCSRACLGAAALALDIGADEQRLLYLFSTLRALESEAQVRHYCAIALAPQPRLRALRYWQQRLWRYAALQREWLLHANAEQPIGTREKPLPVQRILLQAIIEADVPLACPGAEQGALPTEGAHLATRSQRFPWRFCAAQRDHPLAALITAADSLECGVDELEPLGALIGNVALAERLVRAWNRCLAGRTPRSDALLGVIELVARRQLLVASLLWCPAKLAVSTTTFRQLDRWLRLLAERGHRITTDALQDLLRKPSSPLLTLLLLAWAERLAPGRLRGGISSHAGLRAQCKADEPLWRELTLAELQPLFAINRQLRAPLPLLLHCVRAERIDVLAWAWQLASAKERRAITAEQALQLFDRFDGAQLLEQLQASRRTKHYNQLLYYCLQRQDVVWTHKLPRMLRLARPRDDYYGQIMALVGERGWW
jgi:hypothetical protein